MLALQRWINSEPSYRSTEPSILPLHRTTPNHSTAPHYSGTWRNTSMGSCKFTSSFDNHSERYSCLLNVSVLSAPPHPVRYMQT